MNKLFAGFVVIIGIVIVTYALIIPGLATARTFVTGINTNTASMAIDGQTNPFKAWDGATADITAANIAHASY